MLIIHSTSIDETNRSKAAEIYNKYYSTMVLTAESILPDKESVEDAVSESMLKIIKNLDKISNITCYKTRGYIVIIVRNTALNILKKQNQTKNQVGDPDDYLDNIPDSDVSMLDNFISEENYQEIVKIIRSLQKSMSDVLYLSSVNDFDNRKISKLLNLSHDVVRMRLSRAKKAIRKILKEMGEVYEKQK